MLTLFCLPPTHVSDRRRAILHQEIRGQMSIPLNYDMWEIADVHKIVNKCFEF